MTLALAERRGERERARNKEPSEPDSQRIKSSATPNILKEIQRVARESPKGRDMLTKACDSTDCARH